MSTSGCHESATVVCAHAHATMPLAAGFIFILAVAAFVALTVVVALRVPTTTTR